MKVVVVYVYPVFGENHDTCAKRFVESYKQCKAEYPHSLVMISNGGDPTAEQKSIFNVRHKTLIHDDTGWDIGAYRKAAKEIPCDLMVFFGGTSYLRKCGWLKRMVESYLTHGEALYGAMGCASNCTHIRTTGFWMNPALLNEYPHPTTSERSSRYEFEHGANSLTSWIFGRGLKALMVTWNGEYEWQDWNGIPNGYRNGDQSQLVCGDRLTSEIDFTNSKHE